MVVAEGLTWLQFISLPHISSLPVNRQMMEFDDYNHQIILEAIARQQHYNDVNDVFAVGSGRKSSTEEFPGGGSGALTFNGTDQYFTALNSDVVNWLPATGEFTIEFFIKKGVGGAGAPRVFSLGNDTGATIGISVEGGYVYVWPYGSQLRGSLPTSYSTDGEWMHVAISRDSSYNTRLYMDGVLKATKTSDNRSIDDTINTGFDLNVGVDDPNGNANFWAGSLTNFRWDNSAIYVSSSLDVPIAPLSTTATTKLLMLGGGSTNPVYDAAQLNGLVNHGAEWTADTPFV